MEEGRIGEKRNTVLSKFNVHYLLSKLPINRVYGADNEHQILIRLMEQRRRGTYRNMGFY